MAAMRTADLCALGFALLFVWDVYATTRTLLRSSRWSWKHGRLLLVSLLFSGSCAVCALSLQGHWFRAWMVAPLGACYLLMIPMPCYFESVDRIDWLHRARNLLFVVVAVACFAIAVGVVPLPRSGG
jgi:hypothetical protein